LRQLVGLVEYDAGRDPFPLTGWDSVGLVGGQRHPGRAVLPGGVRQENWSPTPARKPATATTTAFVLRSGAVRFVLKGGVDPASPLLEHHRRHGDGVIDIALEVPDVDRAIAHARAQGAAVVEEPTTITDEHGTVRSPRLPHTARPGTVSSTVPLHRPLPGPGTYPGGPAT